MSLSGNQNGLSSFCGKTQIAPLDLIKIGSRGAVCVFPQNEDNPFWIPERLTRKIQTDQGNTDVPRLGDVQGVNNKERAALGDNVDISTPNDGDV